MKQLKPLGWHTARLAEASDAGSKAEYRVDGKDGDVAFPHGNLKPIYTIGEYDAITGYMPTGVPDGMGAMKLDDVTMRFISQSESYGYLGGYPTFPMEVNGGAAKFTGSKAFYVDYDIAQMKEFMTHSGPAAPMIRGAGSLIETVVNLKGDQVQARNTANANTAHSKPHYSQTSASGVHVQTDATKAESLASGTWNFMSFCSSHLEEKHQWGANIGFEDDIYLVPEEWTAVDDSRVTTYGYVGLPVHAIDVQTKTSYAVGAFGQGGYEKVVEVNCGNSRFACVSLSGYNGNFGGDQSTFIGRKQAVTPTRSDGSAWAYTQNVVPARMYIGVKGYTAAGVDCTADNSCGFLEKNGLAYGKVYGFAVDSSTADRDAFHKGALHASTATLSGAWASTNWQWDGTVKDFEHDIAWEFQESPIIDGAASATHKFWTAKGRDASGAKTEHNSPNPGFDQFGTFVQGSTAGYYGIYSTPTLKTVLDGLTGSALPSSIPGTYELIEGESDVNDRIHLGGKGMRADGANQTMMYDKDADKSTFEDIDGLEWIRASDGDYFVIEEDGGNRFGERVFISKKPEAGVNPEYHFVAQAGGSKNTRSMSKVSVPPKTWTRATSFEFSGVVDFSGILSQSTLGGFARRTAEAAVAINDKIIALGLQAHGISSGLMQAFGLDRGGQVFAWKPQI